MYGTTAPFIERGILDDWSEDHITKLKLSEWSDKMLRAQQVLLKIAEENQRQHDDSHMATTNTDSEITSFAVNSFVLVAYPEEGWHKGPPEKTMTNLRGPLRVVSNVGPVYTLLDLSTNREEEVHIKRLRPFHFDPDRVDPMEVANAEKQLWTVERILDHKGSPKSKNTLSFRVKWKDLSEDRTTWEPWAHLKSNWVLHAYLREHGMAKLIPKSYLRAAGI
jgi:hypothetical protein